MRRYFTVWLLTAVIPIAAIPLLDVGALQAQVTTSSVSGRVVDQDGNPIAGAAVTAVHVPSATRYGSLTRSDGRFIIPGMRVGGPYTVTASLIGYERESEGDVFLALGAATNIDFTLRTAAVELRGIVVTAEAGIMSPERTGAATAVSREAIENLPTISRRIEDFARLTPQYSGAGFGFSFAGQDNRLNNVTVDGSYFNNSFGLAGQPGDRTGVAPISMDAIEQIQVNIAPYDVRQGNFVGAGVNSVTRSGTNQFRGSLYHQFRDDGFVGTKAGATDFDPGTFKYNQIGGWLAGPIVQDRLFFFLSFEDDDLTEPGTTFRANRGGEEVGGSVTRVLASDLDALSAYLNDNFNYVTGPYEGYNHGTPGTRFLGKLDYNLNERNKLSLRYTHLDSNTDVPASNSSSLGFGSRRSNLTALNFQNSNYIIQENIRSVVGEWNSMIGDNMSNSLILGYTHHDESRDSRGTFFPGVDILQGGSTYTTFGFEPFTPNNELRYSSFQLQNNFSVFRANHTLTFGASIERYESENVFFPGSQSYYSYNSLEDFYTDANDFLAQCGSNPDGWANCSRTSSPVELRRFQLRWANIPGMEKPIQPLEVLMAGLYAQDVWQVNDGLSVTLGLRVDVPRFGNTAFTNPDADALSFRDEDGLDVRYQTGGLPSARPHFSPRVGFNWDPTGDRTTQVRGGSGIFTGRPAYVWVSNQIGNTGVLTGFEALDNTMDRPWHPDPHHYKPANVTGEPASAFELALTDPDFKFPQLWRSNVAVDQRLPWDLIGTAEFMYSRDINGIYYINANLPAANTSFTGVDDRPRWTAGNRIHSHVANAIVLKNQSEGYSWNFAASLERPFGDGFFAKAAYSYGVAKNTVNPGSIAFGSYINNPHSGDPNNPGLGHAFTSPGHRIFTAASYQRDFFNFGPTMISLFWEGFQPGNASYTFSGDINGDGGTNNDLIYIPRDVSEMNFVEFEASGRTFTVAEQEAAWEAYIQQDSYLSSNRGRYAERNAAFLPMVFRADLSIAQEIFRNIGGSRNALQVRADFLNVGNLLNSDWGVGKAFVSTQPLIAQGADAQGRVQYRLRNIGDQLISESHRRTSGFSDVYRFQLSLRYTFN